MAELRLACLGDFQVTLDGKPLTVFQTDKSRALLIYLAIEGQVHQRSVLAQFLWPGYGEESARNSLRQALHQLRQLLPDGEATPWFLLTRQTVQINPAAAIHVDVATFTQLINACTTHTHDAIERCAPCLARLQQAVDLYHGDFLSGFTVDDSAPFDEWQRVTQERLHIQMLNALTSLANAAESAGDEESALKVAQHQLVLEPWLEAAHRQIMRILARRGQRAAALAQYQRCRQVLAEELGVTPEAETLALVEQIQSGSLEKAIRRQVDTRQEETRQGDARPGEAGVPDVAAAAAPTANLPSFVTPLVGRAQAVVEISTHLQRPELRLLTLIGPGGMGKTRLAVAVAAHLLSVQPPLFTDGIFFVPLASIRTPAALAGAIATALGLALQGAEPQSILLQMLRPKQLLLILDNFEHLLGAETDAVELVVDLIKRAPGVKILLTARERLNLREEQLYPVQPLTFSTTATLTEAADATAVHLFVQSVQRMQADFQLTAHNLAAVLRICRLVEGMPLGLELAAANVGSAPLVAIADAIEQSAEFLTVDWRDLPERHRSMHAVFASSWRLLPAEEQRVLRQSAIFRGGFTYNAAKAVTGATLNSLRRLTDKSLLQWQATATGEGRYVIHELLRQFAAAELNAAGERPLVEEQHSRYYLAYLAGQGLRLGRHEPKEASAEIQWELDNIRLAWQWAASAGLLAALDQAVYAWWQFCQFQGLEAEGRQSFALAIEKVRHQLALSTGNPAAPLLQQPRLAQQLLAKLLAIHANYLFAQGRNEEMAAQAREAMELGAASGGFEGEIFGTFVLGRVLQDLEQKREAMALWQQTIELVRRYQANHADNELLHEAHWMAHNWLRGSALNFGDYAASRAYIGQALQICQTLGKRRGELFCLAALAGVDFLLYDVAAAERGFTAALQLARTLGYRQVEMAAQEGLSGVLRLAGDYRAARTLLQQAVRMAAELFFPYDEALFLAALVRLHCQLGDQAAATQCNEQLTQLLARVKLPKECQLYGYLAAAVRAYAAGALHEALRLAEEANQINQNGGDILFRLVDTALILGHVRAAVGQWATATAAFQEALVAFQQFGNQALAAEPRAGLAQIALAQGDRAAALVQVEAILPVLATASGTLPHVGYNDPFFIYLTCYRVLVANGDARAAPLLQQAYALLQQDANALDAVSRHSFLSAVPTHRDLVAAYLAMQTQLAPTQPVTGFKAPPNTPATQSPPHLVTLSPLYNLPAVLTPLVGRERELTAITERLQQPTVRLLTLVGPSGMGKTRLALAAAARLAPHFSAGVCLVELADVSDPALLPQAVAAALGQTKPAELGGEDVVASYLHDKQLLLVLDNCEHLRVAAAYWSKQWLNACPALRILTTGHGALVISGEYVWSVPTLAYPPPSAELTPEQMLAFEAVQLFVTRAQEVKADFALTPTNGRAVAQICQQLEGIPLALELAAARVKLLTPAEIAARLNECINATMSGNQSAPVRHQTMHAALTWSFDSLDADEQRLFQQLAPFVGGFSLHAVEAITERHNALAALSRLIDRALVTVETLGEQTRYRMLGVIRRYAYDKLTASGAAPELRQRHANYFLHLAEQAQLGIKADGEALWLQPEADNLSSVVDWALSTTNANIAVRLAGALTWYWWMRGYLRTQYSPLQAALAQLDLSNLRGDGAMPQAKPSERATLALAAGALLALWEEPVNAQMAFTQALALAEAEQNQHLAGMALRRLAAVAIQQKEYEAANDFIARGLAIWQALGVNWHIAWLYAHQGDLTYQRGDQRQAWLAYEASVKLPVDPGARAYPFRRMAYLAMARGSRDQALALCRESLQLNLASGDRQGMAACLVGIAHFDVIGTQPLPQATRLPLLQRAAQLLGAVEALLKTVEGRLLQADEASYQQTTRLLQEQLAAVSPVAYQAALATGRALTVEQATTLALQADALAAPVEPRQQDNGAKAQPDKTTADKAAERQADRSPPEARNLWARLAEITMKEAAAQPASQEEAAEYSQPALPAPLLDCDEMPVVDFFTGRASEMAQLTAWLAPSKTWSPEATAPVLPARLISILGIGGMGKTTLAAAVTKAVAPTFAVVIWRSLINAPPLPQLLRSWLQVLSRQTLTTLPPSLDEQLRLLLTYLQQERCLLVLDNVESIFAATPLQGQVGTRTASGPLSASASRAGVTRPGYEGYDLLFQRLASSEHQSCLLLTSREQPYALLRLGRQVQERPPAGAPTGRSSARVLPLTGLDQQASTALLQSNGLYVSQAEAGQLIDNYSGNPLALQIVAATIADFFAGDIRAFQQAEGSFFDGIRLVLDQQFARLSPLERDILVWLAIEREAVAVATLRANLVPPAVIGELLEALQALQNRSLLETRDTGLTLQNVIMEYTTEYLVTQVCQEIIDGRVKRQPLDSLNLETLGALSFLNRFALLKAQAKEYVRQSQERLILQPVAERLRQSWGASGVRSQVQQLLNELRQAQIQRGYAAGNLVNLLLYLGIDLSGYDFSHLYVWQADLRSSIVQNVNFAHADLSYSSFTQTFSRIEDVAISPDGQLLAAAGDGGAVRLFRLPSGEPHRLLTGHTNTITAVDFSPDGAYLVSTGDDGTVRLWTINDGRLHHQFDEQMPMRAVAFSPNGRLLAGASRNGTVLLWDVESGCLLSTLPLHGQRVNALAFHPDGTRLASAGSDGVIYFWEFSKVQHDDNPPFGSFAAILDNLQESLSVHRLISDPEVRFFAATFSQDGRRFVAGGSDGKLYVWDAPFDRLTHQVRGHQGEIRTVAFCSDSIFLFSAGYDGVIRLWDSNEMRCRQTLTGHKETVYALALGLNDRLMATGSEDATICLWEVNPQTQSILRQRMAGYPQALECVAWSGCGRWLATGDIHGTVRLWHLQHETPRCTQEITGESTVIAVDFTPDGQQLVIGRYADPNGIQLWEVDTADRWHLRSGRKLPMTGVACFAPKGALLATCANDGNLHLWNTQTLARYSGIKIFSGHSSYVNRLIFTADSQTIASCGNDRTVRLWQIDTGAELNRFPGAGNNTCLAVNAQGTLLACSAPDFTIALWDLTDPAPKQPLRYLSGHTNEAFACAFSPDGDYLVSAGLDRSVRLWDVQTGVQLTLLGHHEQYALGVAFSPDGKQVASIGKEGALQLWQLAPYDCLYKLQAPGPYQGMNITGVTGISDAQKAALRVLGAVEE